MSNNLIAPENITILPLPPDPMNPVENIWQFMRENWLPNRVFNSYEDIVNHCCTLGEHSMTDSGRSYRPETQMGERFLINDVGTK